MTAYHNDGRTDPAHPMKLPEWKTAEDRLRSQLSEVETAHHVRDRQFREEIDGLRKVIAEIAAERDRLRQALEPLAEQSRREDLQSPIDTPDENHTLVRRGYLRAALRALSPPEGGPA